MTDTDRSSDAPPAVPPSDPATLEAPQDFSAGRF